MSDTRLLLIDGSVLDLQAGQLLRAGGAPQHLEPREVSLLRYLGRHAGRRVDPDALQRDVWELPPAITERDVTRQSQRIRKCVRKLREKLEPDPSAPIFLITRSGGYLLDPTGGRYGGRQPAPPGENNNLRHPRDTFVGRSRELAELEHRLRDGESPLLIWGPGGAGKSRLALHLALSLSGEYTPAGGAWICPLRECRSQEDVLTALSDVLPLPPIQAKTLAAAAAELGRGLANLGRTLLVLDNLEQLEPDALELLSRWVEGAPELHSIWTCRDKLSAPTSALQLGALPEADALDLLQQRAPPELSPREAARISRQLDGLPLAIELAAASCTFTSPEELLSALSTTGGAVGRSLRSVVDWSWQLLTPGEQRALATCAVFRGSFDLRAFEAVIGPDAEPLPLARALEQRSLLRVERSGSRVSLALTTMVRRYAEERLREGAAPGSEARHRDHYLARGEALDLACQLGDPQAMQALSSIALELRAILERDRRRAPQAAARAALLLCRLWLLRGPLHSAVSLLSELLRTPLPDELRTRLLIERGAALRLLRIREGARRDLEEALALAEQSALACTALNGLGMLALQGGDIPLARKLLHRALERARAAECWQEAGRSHAALMALERISRQLEQAERHYHQGMEAATLAGDRACSRRLLGNLALLRRHQGLLEEAEQAHREEIELHEALGDRRAVANARANLGALMLDMGRLEEAEESLRLAEELQLRLGNRTYAAVNRDSRALAALERGQLDRARELLLSALRTHEELGDRRLSKDLCDLMLLALAEGDPEGARRCAARAREVGVDQRVEGYLLALEALLPGADGSTLERARQALEQARDRCGLALVALIQAGGDEGLEPPPSVYYRVVRRLLAAS